MKRFNQMLANVNLHSYPILNQRKNIVNGGYTDDFALTIFNLSLLAVLRV